MNKQKMMDLHCASDIYDITLDIHVNSDISDVYIYTYMWVSINGDPQNGWFIMENTIETDDEQGYPHFMNPP